jgi:hypothetical protein
MAWEAVSKEECAFLSGCSVDDIRDEWYKYIIGYIAKYGGYWNPGDPKPVTEVRNGHGGSVLKVSKPPILSVTSLGIDSRSVGSEYYIYDNSSIYIASNSYNRFPSYTFARGIKNIAVSYISGTEEADGDVQLCIALCIKELANQATAEGANSRITMFKPNRADAIAEPLVEWGIHGKLKGIVQDIIGIKKLAR